MQKNINREFRSCVFWRKENNMTIRENLEQMECTNLSPYACLSKNSKGREREEKQCDIRPVFQRD